MLSLGSGNCSSELIFATHNNFEEILCTDIAEKSLNLAKNISKEKKLNNIKFEVHDINRFMFPENSYDIVYFKASLHHFKNVEDLLGKHIKNVLKKDGLLIIDEFVGPNRFQFPKYQIKAINQAIQLIPKKYRKRYKLNLYRNKVYGSGLIRMIIADPSECIDSENILPSIHKHYNTIYESEYGGNILMTALKDISHHFIEMDDEKEKILDELFLFEDNYLKTHPSDFMFGVYQSQ
jgi:ubiquinone/menaquinone biosynthesis C-methylase UbiE